jgi:phenylalanyl-tRNA synthetase beta chain
MKFSYNWLQSFFNRKLPQPKKLADVLSLHSFEVESVKKAGKDFILDIDILPNRAHDCLSHIGAAREIGAILNLTPKFYRIKVKEEEKENIKNYLQVEVRDKKGCLRYTARMIKGIKVGPSPKWIQERLRVCGLRPINNIVDATNYVMLETGQPLHAFDFNKVSGIQNQKSKISPSQISERNLGGQENQNEISKFRILKKIIVRRAKEREKIATLDNKTFYLDKDILVIADLEGPLAIAGIKGGKKAEIDKKTKDIILESANFEMRIIRRARQKLRIATDASLRFEHQLDKNLTKDGLERVCRLIQEIAGGEIISETLDFYPVKVKPEKVKLAKDLASKLLGVKISEKEIINILKRLEFKILKNEKNYLVTEIPTFRQDISTPSDLVEEIGRIYGLDKIPTILPLRKISVPGKNNNIFWENEIKNFLKELGFSEVYNYSFVSDRDLSIFGYESDRVLEIDNPISKEFKYLRPSLIPNLLKGAKENFKYFEEIRIFELGKVFYTKKTKLKNAVGERAMISGLILKKNNDGEDFYRLKGYIDSLLNKLGISDIYYDGYEVAPLSSGLAVWNIGKSAAIKVGGREIGFLGEVSPAVLKSFGINEQLVLFDIDFEKLAELALEEQEYQPISQYPAAVRDLAVLVPKETKVVEVLNKINAVGGALIRDIDLFDIYEGEELPEGKKNLAFHIIYQAENRTLSSKEIDRIQNKIIRELEKDPEWEVRK